MSATECVHGWEFGTCARGCKPSETGPYNQYLGTRTVESAPELPLGHEYVINQHEGKCAQYIGGDPEKIWAYCGLPRAAHQPPTTPALDAWIAHEADRLTDSVLTYLDVVAFAREVSRRTREETERRAVAELHDALSGAYAAIDPEAHPELATRLDRLLDCNGSACAEYQRSMDEAVRRTREEDARWHEAQAERIKHTSHRDGLGMGDLRREAIHRDSAAANPRPGGTMKADFVDRRHLYRTLWRRAALVHRSMVLDGEPQRFSCTAGAPRFTIGVVVTFWGVRVRLGHWDLCIHPWWKS